MSKKGILYIISAPSGAGKTSLVHALLKEEKNIQVSISHTTRAIRATEKEGVNYHFVAEPEFKKMITQNKFLEHAEVFGHFYGTSSVFVKETLASGTDIILEIDWQGARAIRTQFSDAESIFILPPSLEELANRLKTRHLDDPDIIESRLKQAKKEISHFDEYDYLICNDKFEEALLDLKSILRTNRLKLAKQKYNLVDLIKSLIE
jgi:guanylate kinase